MVYDKTIFKPEEVTTLSGRYKLSVVETEEASGQSDASVPETGGSSDKGGSGSSDSSDSPSQFDLGDFSKMKPAEDAADGQSDELPLLGGPDIDK